MQYRITVLEQTYAIEIGSVADGIAQVTVDQVPYAVRVETLTAAAPASVSVPPPLAAAPARPAPAPPVAGGEVVSAPIPGVITALKVGLGDAVHPGQVVATMEAMKMENNLVSHRAGRVREIRVQKGTEVATGDVVMVIG